MKALSIRQPWAWMILHGGRGDLLAILKGRPNKHCRMPTLLARDWRSGKASGATMAKNSRPLNEYLGGTLNSAWCDWYMGFPVGWTELKPLEMRRFQQWQQAHGALCSDDTETER